MWDDEQRLQSWDLLLEKKKHLLEAVEDTEEALAFLERSRPVEVSEEAQEEAASSSLKTLDNQVWQELVSVERALVKLQNNTYGICEACGKDIDVERIAALPAVQFCVSCQEEKEAS